MMRRQAAPPKSSLSALAAHSPRSAGVAASAGIASRRPTQSSSPPDPRAAMLFLPALRSDETRTAVMTLAPTADILPSSTHVRDGATTLVERPAHPFTTLLLRTIALFASLNWASRACCCTLGGATARSPGGIYMSTVVLNRRNFLVAGGSVLATGVSGLLLPARAEGLAPTPSMSGGAN